MAQLFRRRERGRIGREGKRGRRGDWTAGGRVGLGRDVGYFIILFVCFFLVCLFFFSKKYFIILVLNLNSWKLRIIFVHLIIDICVCRVLGHEHSLVIYTCKSKWCQKGNGSGRWDDTAEMSSQWYYILCAHLRHVQIMEHWRKQENILINLGVLIWIWVFSFMYVDFEFWCFDLWTFVELLGFWDKLIFECLGNELWRNDLGSVDELTILKVGR